MFRFLKCCCFSRLFLLYLSYRTVVNMTKIEIVEAAFKVWGRDFYRKTSLSQLAKELGVSKPALYRHFLNKKALNAAMTEYFCDDFADSVRADFEHAPQNADTDEGIFAIMRGISGYFARNVYALLFCIINIYDRNLDGRSISERLKARGVEIKTLRLLIEKKYDARQPTLQLIFATLIFYMSHFHRTNDTFEKPPCEELVQCIAAAINEVIKNGLKVGVKEACSLDFKKLESMVEASIHSTTPEPLFKAVAEAVAEAGPWDASMEMVAKRIGLSKSTLYGHFKNKKDMVRRLFMGEFRRIIEFARQGIRLSENTAEQLYLGIYSIVIYLRSRPEILIAIGWMRTRKLEPGKHDKKFETFRLFEDLEIERLQNSGEDEKQRISHWILFLLINILLRPYISNNGRHDAETNAQNDDIHILYRLITLGLGGFIR